MEQSGKSFKSVEQTKYTTKIDRYNKHDSVLYLWLKFQYDLHTNTKLFVDLCWGQQHSCYEYSSYTHSYLELWFVQMTTQPESFMSSKYVLPIFSNVRCWRQCFDCSTSSLFLSGRDFVWVSYVISFHIAYLIL